MDNLPIEITRIIYEYDDTFKIEFDKVLKQLKCHCFIYRCSKCLKPYNTCYCYCVTCRSLYTYCKRLTTYRNLPMQSSHRTYKHLYKTSSDSHQSGNM